MEVFLVYSESDSGVTYLALDDFGTLATFPVSLYDGQVCKLIFLGKLHPMLYWRKFRKFSADFFVLVNRTVYESTVFGYAVQKDCVTNAVTRCYLILVSKEMIKNFRLFFSHCKKLHRSKSFIEESRNCI